MRLIKKHLSLWRIVLLISVAAIAIPIASRVSSTAKALAKERPDYLAHQTTAGNEHAYAKHRNDSKAAAGEGVARPQDDYYERRREYWDKRIERKLDRHEEYLDEQTLDDKDNADAKESKDNKAGKDDADEEDDSVDQDVKRQEDEIERRREYWRKRLDKDW
jgi:hypothetical protein